MDLCAIKAGAVDLLQGLQGRATTLSAQLVTLRDVGQAQVGFVTQLSALVNDTVVMLTTVTEEVASLKADLVRGLDRIEDIHQEIHDAIEARVETDVEDKLEEALEEKVEEAVTEKLEEIKSNVESAVADFQSSVEDAFSV